MPPKRPKRWTDQGIPPQAEAMIARLFDRLCGLEPDRSADGDEIPKTIPMTAQALRVFKDFFREHGDEQVELTGDISTAWSKLEECVPRFVLILHMLRVVSNDPTVKDPNRADEACVENAVTLVNWFKNEARRVYGMLHQGIEVDLLQRRIDLIERKGGRITARDYARSQTKM
jgi:hypothetical protein